MIYKPTLFYSHNNSVSFFIILHTISLSKWLTVVMKLWKKITIFVLVLTTMTGCTFNKNIKIDCKTYILSKEIHCKIILNADEEKYCYNINKVLQQISAISKHNSFLFKSVNKIIICKDVLKESNSDEDYHVQKGVYSGLATPQTKTIYISVKDYSDDSVMHELFHLFDASFGKTNLSETNTFYQMASTDYERIQQIFDYKMVSGKNINELFVNLAMDYVEDGDRQVLKQNFPEIYQYINEYIQQRKNKQV